MALDNHLLKKGGAERVTGLVAKEWVITNKLASDNARRALDMGREEEKNVRGSD